MVFQGVGWVSSNSPIPWCFKGLGWRVVILPLGGCLGDVVEERAGMPGHQHFPSIVERSTELPLTVGVVMFVIV